MTVNAEDRGKAAQLHPMFSKKHDAEFAARTSVERVFSTAKSPDGSNLRKGTIRVLGPTKISLMETFMHAAENFHTLRCRFVKLRHDLDKTFAELATSRAGRGRTYAVELAELTARYFPWLQPGSDPPI